MAAVPTSNSSVPVPLELSDGTSARPPSLAENGVAWAWTLKSIDIAVLNTTDTSVWRRMTSPFVTVEIAICLNRPRKCGPRESKIRDHWKDASGPKVLCTGEAAYYGENVVHRSPESGRTKTLCQQGGTHRPKYGRPKSCQPNKGRRPPRSCAKTVRSRNPRHEPPIDYPPDASPSNHRPPLPAGPHQHDPCRS